MSGNYLGYLLGFVLFVSCSHEQDKKQRTSSINLRQQYVKTNKFLDVDMSKFLPGTQIQASVTAEDSAQMFVALYRFYSHVKVVDDAYVCDLTNAQEIQVSERVFRSLSENLQKTNLQIQRLKEQGKKVTISEITPEYLNSLLENEGVQKVFGTLDLFVSLLETEIKYPILQGGILPFWTPSFILSDIYIAVSKFVLDFRVEGPILIYFSVRFVPAMRRWSVPGPGSVYKVSSGIRNRLFPGYFSGKIRR